MNSTAIEALQDACINVVLAYHGTGSLRDAVAACGNAYLLSKAAGRPPQGELFPHDTPAPPPS